MYTVIVSTISDSVTITLIFFCLGLTETGLLALFVCDYINITEHNQLFQSNNDCTKKQTISGLQYINYEVKS